MKRTRKLMCAALLAAALPLAACQRSEEPAPSGTDTEAEAGPDAAPGLALAGGKLVLPVVAGRPGVAYFKLSNGGENAVALAGVHVEGAESAEVHRTEGGKMSAVKDLRIPAGETVQFAQGGLHVMVFGITDTLEAGGTTEMTLTFANGDKLSSPIAIESMTNENHHADH